MNDIWYFIGFSASILSAASFFPEVVKAIKTKHLEDISWGLLFCVISSSILWLLYGVRFNLSPLIISSSFNLVMNSILFYIKYKFKNSKRSLKKQLPSNLDPAFGETEV